jgi:hypothetical protein
MTNRHCDLARRSAATIDGVFGRGLRRGAHRPLERRDPGVARRVVVTREAVGPLRRYDLDLVRVGGLRVTPKHTGTECRKLRNPSSLANLQVY